jgi:hypothetical protein
MAAATVSQPAAARGEPMAAATDRQPAATEHGS